MRENHRTRAASVKLPVQPHDGYPKLLFFDHISPICKSQKTFLAFAGDAFCSSCRLCTTTAVQGTLNYTPAMHYSRLQKPLNNQWHWLRHGQSTANIQHVIASDPATSPDNHGLSNDGAQQVRDALSAHTELNCNTKIIASDFLRTRQTAEIAADCLHSLQQPAFDRRLRKRFFGNREATPTDNYLPVWQLDAQDATHTHGNV